MKILFTDLDGTLLDDKKRISAKNSEAIEKMRSLGHKVVICTGRPLSSAVIQAKRLGLDVPGCYVIAFNGAQIYDFSENKVIFSESVPVDIARKVLALGEQEGIHVHTYNEVEVLSPEEDTQVKAYCDRILIPFKVVPDIKESLSFDVPKLLAVELEKPEILNNFQEKVNAVGGDMIDTFFSSRDYLEVVRKGMSKGNAVRYLCEYLRIPIEDSIACGDGENDLPMIECAGFGVCMKNGEEQVKKISDYVTERTNNEDGVAEVIEKFIL